MKKSKTCCIKKGVYRERGSKPATCNVTDINKKKNKKDERNR